MLRTAWGKYLHDPSEQSELGAAMTTANMSAPVIAPEIIPMIRSNVRSNERWMPLSRT